jgi:hypothetical protein
MACCIEGAPKLAEAASVIQACAQLVGSNLSGNIMQARVTDPEVILGQEDVRSACGNGKV